MSVTKSERFHPVLGRRAKSATGAFAQLVRSRRREKPTRFIGRTGLRWHGV